jgi:hypothetical protein
MSERLLNKIFGDWTKGLTQRESLMVIFERIRDIPYYLVPQIDDPLEWGLSIVKNNKGSCSPKHYLLGVFFEKSGIPIKYATFPFRWDEQKVDYPQELRRLAQGSPIGYHVACKAFIENKWVLIDATWDKGLLKSEFPVNAQWDGLSGTLNAIVPLEEIVHASLEERLSYVKKKKALYSEEEKLTYGKFITGFNSWLERLRGE